MMYSHTLTNACPLLSTTVGEHGADCMKGRFNALSIHQACYNFNNDTTHADNDSIINYIYSLQDNGPALLQVDIICMTPLHIYLVCQSSCYQRHDQAAVYQEHRSWSSPKCQRYATMAYVCSQQRQTVLPVH